MRTPPTLDPMVTPRWLRKQRLAQRRARLRARDRDDAATRPLLRIGDRYFLGPKKSFAQLAQEQGVGPFDPERARRGHISEEDWEALRAAVAEGRVQPS